MPGQPVHEATRKVVLAGADGVVFVADSGETQREANRVAWASLVANLAALGLERLPIVVQYNKRDLPGCAPRERARSVRRFQAAWSRRRAPRMASA